MQQETVGKTVTHHPEIPLLVAASACLPGDIPAWRDTQCNQSDRFGSQDVSTVQWVCCFADTGDVSDLLSCGSLYVVQSLEPAVACYRTSTVF